jgi:SAM-dependent methyltransferase
MSPRWTSTLRSIARRDGLVAAMKSLGEWIATRVGLFHSIVFRELTRAENEERFDERHGTDTGGLIHAVELGLQTRDHFGYSPMPKEMFEWAIANSGIEPGRFSSFVFIDLGSGKGRALLRAALHPFRRIVGVEISDALCHVARRNAEIFGKNNPAAPPFEVLNLDAAAYRYPAEDLLVLLVNQSFGGPVLAEVVDHIAQAGREHGREIIVAIAGPARIAVVERSGQFSLRAETHGGRRKVFKYSGRNMPGEPG